MTYSDQCLERASKTTPGPWKYDYGNWEVECDNLESDAYRDAVCYVASIRDGIYDRTNPVDPTDDAEFIAHARTDVEELAKRLNKAIYALKVIGADNNVSNPCSHQDGSVEQYANNVVAELEAPLEGK